MKARVKATGEIVEVERVGICADIWALQEDATVTFEDDELDVNLEPDYLGKLKHQYAGMAMQGLVMNPKLCEIETSISIASTATTIASALIDKLKEDSQCEK